ncbi:ABC transporter transmembrane region [Ceratobasidium sp. AG-Ba]|nr:ABC transporter transmembrane region [Ceratobasidium sp. AG-Ba]
MQHLLPPGLPLSQGHPLATILCVAAASSVVILVLQTIYDVKVNKWLKGALEDQDARFSGPIESRPHLYEHVNTKAFVTLALLRLEACAALSSLCVANVLLHKSQHETDSNKKASWRTHKGWASDTFVYTESSGLPGIMGEPEMLFCIFYIYTVVLAILTLILGPRLRAIVNAHLSCLLILAFGVHIYIDLLPLAWSTYPQYTLTSPWLTCIRLSIVGVVALIIPGCTPRPYLPTNLNHTDPPNPEQTASLLSLISYQFLDSLIWKAYRARKLPYDELPPLADYDRAEYLKERSFDQLDPLRMKKKRHLFWGLMHVFRKEYCIMAAMITTKVRAPLGIRYLLQYLSDPSNAGLARPWVWVFWLFVGPVIGSVSIEWYKFVACRAVTHAEAMLTQLIFEHTLRVRLNIDQNDKASERGSNLIGRITNLMSMDSKNITEGCDFLLIILGAPIQIVVSMVFLYKILGWSALIGTVVMLLSMLVPIKLGKAMSDTQGKRMKKAIESFNLVRMIKMFAWEKKIKDKVVEKREEELYWCKRQRYLTMASNQANFLISTAVMISTYATYTLWMKQSLDASIVFSSITVFDILRAQLQRLLWQLPSTIQAQVSLVRVNDFLNNTELLDAYSEEKRADSTMDPSHDCSRVGFRNAMFTWAPYTPRLSNTQERNFSLRIDGDLLFQSGKINVITGPTGSGKTSLLMALLGEMHFTPTSQDSWFSLPRDGGVAYAAQEPWLHGGTIRENILFGSEYEEERYMKGALVLNPLLSVANDIQVISQCALERDFELLDAADETQVGDRGVTLSGGQKARVSLARAVYSKAAVLILDGTLSALDTHTSRLIVDRCLKGDLIRGRTVLFVTHKIAMVSEISDFVVLLGPEGRIANRGSVTEVFGTNPELHISMEKDREGEQNYTRENYGVVAFREQGPTKKSKKVGMAAEELAKGRVRWSAITFFLIALGGPGFWILYLAGSVLTALTVLLQTYWLGTWAREYDAHTDCPEHANAPFYLGVYGTICIFVIFLSASTFAVHADGSVRASRHIYDRLLASLLAAPLRWFDSTPSGRITSRFTQDLRSIDTSLPNTLHKLVDLTIQLVLRLSAILIFSPAFVFPGVALLVIGIWIGQVYITAQLWVKREMSNARSPVFGHFGAALAGVATIRAYGAEEQLKSGAMDRIDKYTRAARSFYNVNRWICVRMDMLGALFAGCLATDLVHGRSSTTDLSDTGFSLNMAIALSGGILWWVRNLNEFEVQASSLERIQDYLTIDQEPPAVPEKVPPAYWPASGSLVVENLIARYSPDGPAVLHGLSFEIKSGERVGVVGRTGSGKSSLILSLLRMIPAEGNVYYDGIPTDAVNLDALRSSITMIPQQPELMSGTVRQNLDPFGEHDDAALHSALHSVGLSTLQGEGDEGYIGLDTAVSAGGGNFSLGQRQIIALARAILRKSKVVILDEATAAIDHKTDAAIQNSIRTESTGMTLIIIAHRLQTICDADKIMVLEAGKIVEFDTPAALLQKPGGTYKLLVDQSKDRDVLQAAVKDKLTGSVD